MAIPLPEPLIDVLVERVAARVAAPTVEPWVGVDEAAAHLCCRRQRVYDLVHRRAIPHRKEGARLLFKLSHLDAWIESGRAS